MAGGELIDEPGAALISPKLAKALANPWRARILAELSVKPLSPSQFVEEYGGELTAISRYFRQLARWGFVELQTEMTGGHRRGGIEHIYRGLQRAKYDTPEWMKLPRFLRDDISHNIIASYIARINEAIEADTFDAEVDRHFSWDTLNLDRTGWTKVTEKLDEVLAWLSDLEAEAAERMAKSGEEPIPTTVGLAAFRSPAAK